MFLMFQNKELEYSNYIWLEEGSVTLIVQAEN